MCASPLSPRHAQPDWMGGGLVSRQMMHAPASAAIFFKASVLWLGSAQTDEVSILKVSFEKTLSRKVDRITFSQIQVQILECSLESISLG